MAKIPSPIGPTIDVASKTISSTVIRGGAGGGGGTVEPQTSAIVRRNATDIVQVRKDINAITKAQTASVTVFRNTIASLSDQFRTIGVSVRDLGGTVMGLNRGITTDTNLEVTKDRQELERERKLAERGVREGKERQLEQKLQNALLAPARFVVDRAKGIFDSLMNAFTLFFLGWLTNRIIDTLRSQSGKTSNIFKAVFDAIIGGVRQYFGSLVFIGKAFRTLTSLAFSITKLISKTLVGGIRLMFKALEGIAKGAVNLAKGAGQSALKVFGLGGAEATERAAARAGTEVAGEATGKGATSIFSRIFGRGTSRAAGAAIPVGGALFDFGFALADFYRGDFTSGLYSTAAGLATLSTPFTGGFGHVASLGLTGMSIKSSMDFDRQQQEGATTQPQQSIIPPKTQPTQTQPAAQTPPSATPFSGSFSVDTTGMGLGNDYGESSTPPKTEAHTTPLDRGQTNLAQTQSMPSSIPQIGPTPSPKPNVVMLSSAQNNQSSTVLQSTPAPASEVPFIPSSNPDNFYILYSQVNYNVVI